MTDAVPGAVPGDSKDWTWVLERRCPECGFDAAAVPAASVAGHVRATAALWSQVLRRPDVHERPAPTTWSPLEYGCHVRDVLRLYDERLRLMRDTDDPLYPNWDQDATAVAERYDSQDPALVDAGLQDAAVRLADDFAALSPEQWARTGRRSDGAAFTVDTFSRYFLHDVVHHLADVGVRGPVGAPASGPVGAR